ncbi:VTC domain-containing protein [Brooklawnia sp.]|uniref:VTC domain-containing protein n=1 Tax=Brooklawnia sp. TaxID=2699740 RepID=UPI00311D9A8A
MTATISLDELNSQSALLDRVDRKYLIEVAELPMLLNRLEPYSRILEIDGLTWFGYHSVYYDTPDLDCYAGAGTGRRRRFKVRTREYLNTDQHFLEVKTRGPRKTTIKDRIDRSDAGSISSDERRWISQTLASRGVRNAPVDELQPILTTYYSRRTVQICPSDAEISRMTIDIGLTCSSPYHSQHSAVLDDYAVVETKGGSRPSPADRALWAMRHRPTSISKFGVGVALLNPQLPDFKWHRVITHQFAA